MAAAEEKGCTQEEEEEEDKIFTRSQRGRRRRRTISFFFFFFYAGRGRIYIRHQSLSCLNNYEYLQYIVVFFAGPSDYHIACQIVESHTCPPVARVALWAVPCGLLPPTPLLPSLSSLSLRRQRGFSSCQWGVREGREKGKRNTKEEEYQKGSAALRTKNEIHREMGVMSRSVEVSDKLHPRPSPFQEVGETPPPPPSLS